MGKKSKRRTKASAPVACDVATATELECPKDGWAVEFVQAEKKAKKNPTSATVQLRVAVAAYQLRQWDICQAASQLGLTLNSEDEDEEKELIYYQKRATTELAAESGSEKHHPDLKNIFREIMEEDLAIDKIRGEHPTFNNLNILQYGALKGDVPLLEKVVALGAALDYPVLDDLLEAGAPDPAPAGSTVLVLTCSILAMYSRMGMTSKAMTKPMRKEQQGREECAIALVNLGADTTRTLPRPDEIRTTNPESPLTLYNQLGLFDKSALELATMSGRSRLVEAMKCMETKEDRIAKAHCRCGSRLPWLQCHAGNTQDHHPIYMDSRAKLTFRYSPLAPCPCKHKAKPYWLCCGEQTANHRYQDDSTGELVKEVGFPVANNPNMQAFVGRMMDRMRNLPDGNASMSMFPEFDGMTSKEIQMKTVNFIRTVGWSVVEPSLHPNSKMTTWDPEVYAGCIERLDNYFFWKDVHWQLDKTELKVRVMEWNEALEKYCDDMELSGAKREAVIAKHTASPCAPCANPGCESMEKKAKEFLRCSRCKLVAYCTVDCQRKAWKEHKKTECVSPK